MACLHRRMVRMHTHSLTYHVRIGQRDFPLPSLRLSSSWVSSYGRFSLTAEAFLTSLSLASIDQCEMAWEIRSSGFRSVWTVQPQIYGVHILKSIHLFCRTHSERRHETDAESEPQRK